ALVGESEGLSVAVRLGEVDRLKRARQRRAGLRVIVGDSTAIVSTADLSPPALDALAREACALARATAPDPHAGLPDPADLAREQPDLDLYGAAARGPARADRRVSRRVRPRDGGVAAPASRGGDRRAGALPARLVPAREARRGDRVAARDYRGRSAAPRRLGIAAVRRRGGGVA